MADHCQFYVVRKKRFCRMTLRAGSQYCGEHEPKSEKSEVDGKDNARIACPLDPKHTCFANKLEKHLKVCNARQGQCPPYIIKNYNVIIDEDGGSTEKRCLSSVSEDVLRTVIQLVERIYEDVISGNISKCPERDCHSSVVEDLDTDGRKDGTRRHLLQTSSLLHILESQGLVKSKTSFIELGAGKGHLSYYLSKTVNSIPECSVVLVDRASHRHKQDNKLKDDCSVEVNRIRADISDLVLSKVPNVENSSFLVAVSKHLCGVATDLALRCLTKSDVVDKTAGLVMATCCHHRCLWSSYVGKSFFQTNGMTSSQFDVICGLVSWATCGSGLSRERRKNLDDEDVSTSKEPKRSKLSSADNETTIDNETGIVSTNVTIVTHENFSIDNENGEICQINKDKSDNKMIVDSKVKVSVSKHLGLSIKQREDIGFKAKAVLDWGRLMYLKDCGFNSYLCFYVDKVLSPENVCIVATK